TSLPHVRAGSAKAFVVTAKKRLAVAPDIPSVDEAGLPVLHFSLWAGLFAPRGTPKDIISKLNTAAVSTLGDPSRALKFRSASGRRRRRLVPIRRPRSRNGGRSSRRRTSRRNKASPTLQRGRPCFPAAHSCIWPRALPLLPALSRIAQAQFYPTRPVLPIIVGFPGGGAAMSPLSQQLMYRAGSTNRSPFFCHSATGTAR